MQSSTIYIPHQLDKNFSVRVIVCIIIIPIYIPHQLDKNNSRLFCYKQSCFQIYIPHQLDKNGPQGEPGPQGPKFTFLIS